MLAALLITSLSYGLLQTAMSPALPAIGRDLHATAAQVTWVITLYLLVISVSTPIVGRLGDMFGKRRMILLVLGGVELGLLVSALSKSLTILIAGRMLQGLGGAVFPLCYGVVRDVMPQGTVGRSTGLISGTFGVSASGGTVMAGLLVDSFSYNSIFWLGLLLVGVAFAAVAVFVTASATAPAAVDWAGAAIFGVGGAGVLLALGEGSTWGWTDARTLVMGLGGAALLAAWVQWERRAAAPMLDLGLFRLRGVWTANVIAVLTGFGMFMTLTLLPRFVQTPARFGYGFGMSVLGSAVYILPGTVMIILSGPLTGAISTRKGTRPALLIATPCLTASLVLLAVGHQTPWVVLVASAVGGLGTGMAYASGPQIIARSVPQSQMGEAVGLNTLMRTVGGALGGQVGATLLLATAATAHALPREAGYTLAFGIGAIVTAAAIPTAWMVPRRRPARLSPEVAEAPAPPA